MTSSAEEEGMFTHGIPFIFHWDERKLVQLGNPVYRVNCDWLTQEDDKKTFLTGVDFKFFKKASGLWGVIQIT